MRHSGRARPVGAGRVAETGRAPLIDRSPAGSGSVSYPVNLRRDRVNACCWGHSPFRGHRAPHDDVWIGRLRLADERSWRGAVWTWNVNVTLPVPSRCNGSAASLEAAKDPFRAAWARFYSSLTPEADRVLAPHGGHRQGERVVVEMKRPDHRLRQPG